MTDLNLKQIATDYCNTHQFCSECPVSRCPEGCAVDALKYLSEITKAVEFLINWYDTMNDPRIEKACG